MIVNTVKQVLLSSLVVLLGISSIVRAQQSPSKKSKLEEKQTARKSVDEPSPANLSSEVNDAADAKLAVYQVHRLGERILALRSTRAKAYELARLAAVLWNQDETHARFLFEKSLNLTTANDNDAEARALSVLHRRIIALIAHNDAEWAKRLIDAAAKRDGEEQGLKSAGTANISTALALLEEDQPVAVQFAERSLKGSVPWGFLDFIQNLRKQNEPEANRLFLQALRSLSQQPAVNISDLHNLGLYLFTAPDMLDSDRYKITLVDQILVPNITADRPGIPAALARAYLATAADVLWRMTSDAEQRKASYALCYMLLPKARTVAPDQTAKLESVMEALAPNVPTGLTNESAYRYLNAAPTTVEEKLNAAENKPNQENRDIAYLEIAYQAWRKGDFKTARIAQGRISQLDASQRLASIIDFGESAWAIKQNADGVAKAETMANRLPPGIERSILLQAIAKIQSKGSNPNLTEETIDKALKAARSMSDSRRPYLLLTAAAGLANLKSPVVHSALAEAIKDFNSFDESSLTSIDWAESIQIGPMKARFPLDVANVDFGFNEAFRSVALADPEAAMARADELRHENLRAQSLVEVGKAFLDNATRKTGKTNKPKTATK